MNAAKKHCKEVVGQSVLVANRHKTKRPSADHVRMALDMLSVPRPLRHRLQEWTGITLATVGVTDAVRIPWDKPLEPASFATPGIAVGVVGVLLLAHALSSR